MLVRVLWGKRVRESPNQHGAFLRCRDCGYDRKHDVSKISAQLFLCFSGYRSGGLGVCVFLTSVSESYKVLYTELKREEFHAVVFIHRHVVVCACCDVVIMCFIE